MKKILFVCYGLGIGGIEKCLVNLVNKLDKELYDIDILPLNPEYELLEDLDNDFNLLDTFEYSMNTTDTYKQYKRESNVFKKTRKMFKYILFRLINKYGNKPWKLFKKIDKKYDIAIAYSQNGFAPYYIIDKVISIKKYMWYHNGDYEKINKKYKLDLEYYKKYDNLIAVSNDCKRNLESYFPNLKNKIIVMNNIVDKDKIIELSIKEQFNCMDKEYFSILTVGRLTKEKGAELAVHICKRLVDNGFKIKWYWVGDGNQFNTVKNLISNLKLEDKFYLLGNKMNPYVYMKQCDLYVQPSEYEAYCTTTNEARILCKPIITTDVGGMRDQFIDRKTALIVNRNIDDLYNAIKLMIEDVGYRNKLISNLKKEVYMFDNYIEGYNNLFLN